MWMQVHLSVALLGWVGTLIGSVSWQVVPMFYLAGEALPPLPPRCRSEPSRSGSPAGHSPQWRIGSELVAWTRGLPVGSPRSRPAALTVWLAHPLHAVGSHRRRKRADRLIFWRAGLVLGILSGVGRPAHHHDPSWRSCSVAGDLGLAALMPRMLIRIVPFLVWFHRFSPLVDGCRPVVARSRFTQWGSGCTSAPLVQCLRHPDHQRLGRPPHQCALGGDRRHLAGHHRPAASNPTQDRDVSARYSWSDGALLEGASWIA